MKATITNVEINLPIDQFKRGMTKEECDAISVFWQDERHVQRGQNPMMHITTHECQRGEHEKCEGEKKYQTCPPDKCQCPCHAGTTPDAVQVPRKHLSAVLSALKHHASCHATWSDIKEDVRAALKELENL